MTSPRLLRTSPSSSSHLTRRASAPIHTSAVRSAQRIYPTNYTPKGIGLAPLKPRKPAPPPPGWTPFAISNLLLDLDAYESRYARPYDDADDARQRAAWAPNPTRDALKQAARDFSPEFRRANFLFAEARGDAASRKWRVGDLDVLTAALLGVTAAPASASASVPAQAQAQTAPGPPAPQQELAIVVKQNAVPSSAARGERLLEWLLHRQAQLDEVRPPDADALEKRLSPGTEEANAAQGEAQGQTQGRTPRRAEWSGFLSWKRLVSAILQTESGTTILAKRTEELAMTMEGLSRPENAADQLAFLNNLQARFHDAGIELDRHLCTAGLVLAAEVGQGRALVRYLRLGVSSGYWQTAQEVGSSALPDLMLQNLRAVLVRTKDGRLSFEESASRLKSALDGEAAAPDSSIGQDAPVSRQPQAASSASS